jgi:deoxyribonuclease-4
MVRVGVHCPVDKTLLSVIDWAKGIQSNTAQYFLQNPHTYQPRKVAKKEWDSFYRILTTERIFPVFIHAPYVVNLCSSDESVREKSIKVIEHLLQVIECKQNSYLIVHAGYHGGSGFEPGFLRFRESLDSICKVAAIHKLVIENSAGQTNAMGGSLEEISRLLDAIPEIGVCIDTAHLWGFGISPKDTVLHRVLSGWQDQQRLKIIHLNNSKDELGSKKDHHAKLNQGRIPEDDLKSFAKVFQQIPFILETPKNSLEEDSEQIRIFKRWFY